MEEAGKKLADLRDNIRERGGRVVQRGGIQLLGEG